MADLSVILGATGALGASIVETFAKRGDRVIAVARSRAAVSELAARFPPSAGGGVSGDTADLTSRLAGDGRCQRLDRIGLPRWAVDATWGLRGGAPVAGRRRRYTSAWHVGLGVAWWECRCAVR